ncbi:MAG: hypothetical protein HRU36_04210 [Rickettsiales bacterium]|nr:hypothetical protein [Rickettsiales bacterium]
MKTTQTQNFYPISMLPTFTGQIDQLIEALEEKHKLFNQAKDSPASLDNALVERALTLLQKNAEHIFLYYEQLNKWKRETVTDAQKKSIDIFAQKISQSRELNTTLIDLVKDLKESTIDKVLEKDDPELGLDFLSKGLKENN